MQRSGHADLPLHGGHVPARLADRMTRMGTGIIEAVVRDYGVSAALSRLSDPFWLQAFAFHGGVGRTVREAARLPPQIEAQP